MNRLPKSTALITGASSGIGAVYGDRLAHRGHDLILVARDRAKLDSLARRLSHNTGHHAEIIVADLNDAAGLERVEEVLRKDASPTGFHTLSGHQNGHQLALEEHVLAVTEKA